MKKIARIIVLLFLMSCPVILFAQPVDPPSWEGNTNVEDNHVPLDDGVIILVGIGVLYGLVRAYKMREKNRKLALIN
jgi:hypothetical protein